MIVSFKQEGCIPFLLTHTHLISFHRNKRKAQVHTLALTHTHTGYLYNISLPYLFFKSWPIPNESWMTRNRRKCFVHSKKLQYLSCIIRVQLKDDIERRIRIGNSGWEIRQGTGKKVHKWSIILVVLCSFFIIRGNTSVIIVCSSISKRFL